MTKNVELDLIIVSTSKYLLAVDPMSPSVRIIDGYRGIYFGVAWCPMRRILFCCTRNSVTGPINLQDRECEFGTILVFDEKLNFIDEIIPPFPLRDTHQMRINGDKLYVVCSFDNMIAIYDIENELWSKWYPHPNPLNRNADINHINSISFENDKIIVVAHNRGASHLMIFDQIHHMIESQELGQYAHDAWYDKGNIYTLSSGEGLVRSQKGTVIRTNGFPRGFCRANSRYAIGISMPALPSDRLVETGFIRIYSNEWELCSEIVLPGVGMVNQLICLSGVSDVVNELIRLRQSNFIKVAEKVDPNYYHFGKLGANLKLSAIDWHDSELAGCWTASKRAKVKIFTTSKCRVLEILATGFPESKLTITFDDVELGEIVFGSESSIVYFDIPAGCSVGGHWIGFVTNNLINPNNGDNRLLGVFVNHIRLLSARGFVSNLRAE